MRAVLRRQGLAGDATRCGDAAWIAASGRRDSGGSHGGDGDILERDDRDLGYGRDGGALGTSMHANMVPTSSSGENPLPPPPPPPPSALKPAATCAPAATATPAVRSGPMHLVEDGATAAVAPLQDATALRPPASPLPSSPVTGGTSTADAAGAGARAGARAGAGTEAGCGRVDCGDAKANHGDAEGHTSCSSAAEAGAAATASVEWLNSLLLGDVDAFKAGTLVGLRNTGVLSRSLRPLPTLAPYGTALLIHVHCQHDAAAQAQVSVRQVLGV